ncbi:dihydrodipicolinate reductase [Roseibacterium sp. KMU-115]|uniref:Dihydrodipicolinate reductase n=1 Tax=Roseicyclus persicicus TaxID=2650661 RepID=A0A7X6H042_9RHOB|nr:dihydrodipicolinate reductase [Roseibacterium persicicum]
MTGALLSVATADAAGAEGFSVVQSADRFVSLVDGRELRRFGIRLNVTSEGQIEGQAFGSPVTGEWTWEGGYFCRDLYWGGDDLGYNCQLVQENGDTLRFTSDRGAGMFADLTLR